MEGAGLGPGSAVGTGSGTGTGTGAGSDGAGILGNIGAEFVAGHGEVAGPRGGGGGPVDGGVGPRGGGGGPVDGGVEGAVVGGFGVVGLGCWLTADGAGRVLDVDGCTSSSSPVVVTSAALAPVAIR